MKTTVETFREIIRAAIDEELDPVNELMDYLAEKDSRPRRLEVQRIVDWLKAKDGMKIKTALQIKAEVRNLETRFTTAKTMAPEEYDATMLAIRGAAAQAVAHVTLRHNAPAPSLEDEKETSVRDK